MSDIGLRLKQERERLGLSQAALGETCGVKKLAQFNYEKGERQPDALYLAALHRAGADVLFVLTGERTAPALLPPDESLLLARYRASPHALRDAALRVLLGGGEAAPKQQFLGPVGQAAGGDITNHGGIHVTGEATAGISRKRRSGSGG